MLWPILWAFKVKAFELSEVDHNFLQNQHELVCIGHIY
jgi:hypothetical protein